MPRSYGLTNVGPYAVAPAVGLAGDTYFNTATKTMFVSDGTRWLQTGGSQAYWMSRCTSGGTIGTAALGTVPVAAAVMSSGFSLSGSSVVCNVAGKYIATFLLMANFTQAGTGATWAGIQQFRGAANIVNWDNIQSETSPYTQVVCIGEFDLAVGDTLTCVAQAPIAGTTIGAQTSFAISPLGGPTGAIGPSGGPVPTGGVLNQIIVKQSAVDFAVAWQDQPGVVAYKFGTNAALAITTTPVLVLALNNVPLKAGRLYRMSLFMRAISTAATANIRFQYTTGTTVGWTSSLDAYTVQPTIYGNEVISALGTVTADGNYSIGVQATSSTGTSSIYTDIGGYMMIEDIGLNRGQQ